MSRLNEILNKDRLTPAIVSFEVYAPHVAGNVLPGQFVVLRTDETGERIPLTVVKNDPGRGSIVLIVQEVGVATLKLGRLNRGECILDVVGPLGNPSHIDKIGTVVCVGGGVGIAPLYPIASAFKQAGNRVISIIGAKTGDMLILEKEMGEISDEAFVCTDDGSRGVKGFVTQALQDLIDRRESINRVMAIGPAVMMKAVSETTRKPGIPTVVSLNSLMVDGTGMCGGCRISVGGTTKFVCVDGPEFDGHLVDYGELLQRSRIYAGAEKRACDEYRCRLKTAEDSAKIRQSRLPMPKQDPKVRVGNFDEVALGYTAEQAMLEASRCLQCKKAPCIPGCPVDIDIPAFIALIKKGDFPASVKKIKEKNSLPAVCGRVCPQEEQCEKVCVLARKGEPVAIGRLERFVADREAEHGIFMVPKPAASSGKHVAVIGAGPAGLTAAGELAKMGHRVTVYEALHKTGGVLAYGIPEFRLPKRIVQRESDFIAGLGVEVRVDFVAGWSDTIDGFLRNGHDAVFIGTGAGLPSFMNIPGENLNGVYSSNEFLTRVNLMKAYLFPKYDTPIQIGRKVAVVGGGNVAMDAARSAVRLGAENVYLVYRRAREQMPAREEEIENAFEEGVEPRLLTNPVRILGNGEGWVNGIECIRMELGDPDDSGRRKPVPVKGSEHVLEVDQVVMAIGNGPNPLLTRTTPDLALNKWGNIMADENTGKTSKRGVFAGGDIVTGSATVILAMGAGKKAAFAIDQFLKDGKW
jgi:glutamate synthase (NADPH) small chain